MGPCEMCASLIIQSNISNVIYMDEYRNHKGIELLGRCSLIKFVDQIKNMCSPEFIKFNGMVVRLSVNDIAKDDKVLAVGVSGFETKNAKAHITLAVNRQEGGKPMMSNNLTNWTKLKRPLLITGKVTEVT